MISASIVDTLQTNSICAKQKKYKKSLGDHYTNKLSQVIHNTDLPTLFCCLQWNPSKANKRETSRSLCMSYLTTATLLFLQQ